MALDCCCRIIKYIVFFVNFLVKLAGIALISLAAWNLLNLNFGLPATPSSSQLDVVKAVNWLFVVLLVLGCIMTLLGFIGCCGAARESQPLLGLLSGFMVLGMILVIIGIAVVATKDDEIVKDVRDGIDKLYQKPKENLDAILALQTLVHCCGLKNATDFPLDVNFPKSCCKNQTVECQRPSINPDEVYFPGCEIEGSKYVEDILSATPPLLFFVGIAQLLAFSFTLALCCAIRRNTYRYA